MEEPTPDPAGEDTASTGPADAGADADRPERIGPYRILDVLGEGGMGTVYLAEQKEPVRRRVALKLIKLGMDSKEVLARFNAERQALAMMEHDNIAKVLEAGTTERGQPYFVMEHVAGLPITEHCDKQRLSTKERLKLFQQVCAGVQHAHQKGVIHRDLKPSNILVSLQQGHAVPKIIDFGIARATDHRLVEATIFTEEGRLLGTPAYMSPEQAEMSSQDIDTRTDVYSLGVILYQLLVGDLPFRTEELRKAGLIEMHRIIREQDPPKPSTRLTTRGTDSEAVARQRATNVHKLLNELRGDLDWVVLKAMEKDRSRRYEAANQLAEDIERYLAHEPLTAGPPSAGYRTRKFLRRNRGRVVAVSTVFLVLFGGIVAFAIENRRARENARLARENEDATRDANMALARQVRETAKAKTRADTKADEAIESARLAEEQAREIGKQKEELELVTLALRDRSSALLQRTNDFDMLALAVLLRDARENARNLSPAWPDRAIDIRAWLRFEARPLREALPKLQETLRGIRTRANASGLESSPLPTYWRERLEVSWLPDLQFDPRSWSVADVEEFERQTPRLETFVEEVLRGHLQAKSVAFLIDTLSRVEKEIEEFLASDVPEVETTLRWAQNVEGITISRHGDRWAEARAAIAAADGNVASTLYADYPIDLQPQMGLVPIGMNPVTRLWEFYHLRSAWDPESGIDPVDIPIPKHDPETGHIEVTDDTGIVFALLPGGTFAMGAQSEDPNAPNHDPFAKDNESPVHEVSLLPFFLARHELTQGQWLRLAGGDNPSRYKPGWRNVSLAHPVEQVDWSACSTMTRRYELLLPTEAQWEYACRAGTTTPWWTGSDRESLVGDGIAANLADQAALRGGATWPAIADWPELDDGWLVHAPVDALRPNPWGLFGALGNVWEWCRDAYELYEVEVRAGDGLRLVPVDGSTNRIDRGGGYDETSSNARSAIRASYAEEFRHVSLGLRVSRAVLP